ncbi:hypothetical protein ABID26_006267 [Mesorhizobium shonense]|uniref:Uncharacterized protein n=1 Tax=Mesorhizobium shonense TaxID=1209948 RepID=A0ABV2I1W3_9HYPH
MIFSQTAESISSGFADEPQDEDAQPADFAIVSNWSKDLVLTKLSSEIVGKDMNGSVPGWTLQFEAQKLCQLKKSGFQFNMSAFMRDSACSLRHIFVWLAT